MTYDVAIVGCGPVGATLANLLGARGVRTLVVEREVDIYRLPRAVHFDGECMRVFQSAGIADTLAPGLIVSPGMKFVDPAGRMLIDWSRPTDIGPMGWHPSYRFHQPTLEETLRAKLADHDTVEVRLAQRVVALDPRDDAVRLTIEDAGGAQSEVDARWVVGCDGARSPVRTMMGSAMDQLDRPERWLVVDVILTRDRPEFGDHSIQFCDPARPSTYVRGVGLRRRWEFMLREDEDAERMKTPDAIWALLARWLAPDEAVLERPAVYTFHAAVAGGWRKGRLLIAGDAAHQTPPFMGQGLCAGIRDASNLAWKLAAVVQGCADASLLDTYETERAPHARTFIETAVRLGHTIQHLDPASLTAPLATEVFRTPQPRLGPGAHDDDGPAGLIGEQARCANGARLDDAIGDGHALLVMPNVAVDPRDDLRVVVADTPALADWLARCDACALLIRPDRHVAAFARAPEEIAPMLDRHFARFRTEDAVTS